MSQCGAETASGGSCSREVDGGKCWQHSDSSDSAHRRLKKFKPEEVENALRKSNGNVTDAANMLGCSRECIYSYCDDYPEVERARNEARRHLAQKSRETLGELLESEDESIRWKAAKEVLKHFEDEKAADRHELDHTSSDGSMSPEPAADWSELSDDEAKQVLEILSGAQDDDG